MTNTTSHWQKKHETEYKDVDWANKPSLFAETAINYFPKNAKILELGAGQGQDSRYFAERGHNVLSTDLEDSALEISKSKLPETLADKIVIQKLNIHETLPFEDDSLDVVYAHLSLHYFKDEDTKRIFAEIKRVLKPGGVLAFFTNSTSDPEYGQGDTIEPDYFMLNNIAKRYFSLETAREYASGFEVKLLDNQGETYKDMAKGVHNLIRFIGVKP